MLPEPLSRLEWLLDSYRRGHSVSETITYANWCADFEDERQARLGASPPGVSPDIERGERWFGFLRRLRGRE